MSPPVGIWIPIVLIPLIAGSVFALAFRARKAADRAAATAIAKGVGAYTQTGGTRLDDFTATIPLANLVCTPDWIEIHVGFWKYNFDKSLVRTLAVSHSFLPPGMRGLRIEHNQDDNPTYVVFWSLSFDALVSALEQFGWTIRR
jgi:hypothetical protein